MGKPDHVSSDIAANARLVLERNDPNLLEQLEPLLFAAEQGNRDAANIFAKSINTSVGVDHGRLWRLVARLADSASTGEAPPGYAEEDHVMPGGTFVLPADMTEDCALDRIWGREIDFTEMTPDEVEQTIFSGMEYARHSRTNPISETTTEDKVRAALAERLGKFISGAFESTTSAMMMFPPTPDSESYVDALEALTDMEPYLVKSWMAWPHWNNAITYHFINVLTGIRETGNSDDPIERIEKAIEVKATWYKSLGYMGVEDHDMERAISRLHHPGRGGYDYQRAMAELRRFVRADDDSISEDPASSGLLASALLMLHAQDSDLEQDRFIELLPHYAYPMTVESIKAMFTRENRGMSDDMLYKAQTALMWHMEPSFEQVESIASLFTRGGNKFKALDSFCQKILNVTLGTLERKIVYLAEQGFFVDPLIEEIEEKFPGQLNVDREELRKLAKPLTPPAIEWAVEVAPEFSGVVEEIAEVVPEVESAEGGDEDATIAAAAVEASAEESASSLPQQLTLTLGISTDGKVR